MKLFLKVIIMVAVSFAVSSLINNSVSAGDDKIPSSDNFIAVEVMPVMIEEVTPIYPDHLRDTQALVFVKAFVNKEGVVKQTEIAKSSGKKAFDDSALHAAMKCKYKPALQNGNPIGVWVTYKVDFVPAEDQAKEILIEEVPDKQDIDIMPEMIYEQVPTYPDKAKEDEIEGVVWIKALVGEDGLVIKSEISKSSGNDLLDKSALKASLECKYKPAVKDSKPISVWVTYKVDFVLGKDENKEKTE